MSRAIETPAKLAAAEYPKEIAKANQRFQEDAEIVESGVIRAANNARYIGMLLGEWIGREQVKFEFFNAWVREHASQLPAGYDATKVKNFIRIAHKLPEPAKDFREAKEALQLTFEAAGLMEVATRTEPQRASPVTPLTFFVNAIGAVKEKMDKWLDEEPPDRWPRDRRETVKAELKWAHELYERLNR